MHSPRRSGSGWRAQAATAACTLFAACASTTEASIESVAPATYRIAVAPVVVPEKWTPTSHDGLALLAVTPDALRDAIVRACIDVRLATEIVDAARGRPDLIVLPRLKSAEFARNGASGHAILANVLWFLTWAGSFPIEDRSYVAALACDFELVDPITRQSVGTIASQSGQVDLAYWDRHHLVPWGLLQSIFVFPFLSVDEAAPTSASLTEGAVLQLARDFKRRLLDGSVPSVANRPVVRVLGPVNGSEWTAGGTRVSFEVTSPVRIGEVRLWIDDDPEAHCVWCPPDLGTTTPCHDSRSLTAEERSPGASGAPLHFIKTLEGVELAASSRHTIHVEVAYGDSLSSICSCTSSIEAPRGTR